MIRIVIAEDHGVVREGLRQLLGTAADVEVVAVATNGQEAIDLAEEHKPDVVLMDLSMPGVDGIEATRRLAETLPESRVVVLTSFSDRDKIMQALDAGAVGYLLKDAEPDDLIRGIEAASRGESPLAPKVAGAIIAERRTEPAAGALSPREREVLELLADGLPNKLIARRLEISEKTVKAHLTRVFAQLNVTDRTQAALWAQKNLR